MKIGIYDPYLDTLGGGEKYILSIASYLKDNHKVFLFWNDEKILDRAALRFNLDLKDVELTKNIFLNTSFFERFQKTRKLDAIFYISDGSVPFLFSKRNILIFQFPVNWVNGKSFFTKIKMSKVQNIICYSDFVKKFLDKTFSIKSIVLPPAVSSVKQNIKKENIILTVGRFTKAINTKKQEVLINAFKKLHDEGLSGWELVIIGSVLPSDRDYVEQLKKDSKNYPIRILENISFNSLVDYYNKAKIYWHAAGFGEDLEKHPEKAEHFGISTVEAMSAGTVPVVFNGGGQSEIVYDQKNGFCWNNLNELLDITKKIINDQKLWQEVSDESKKRAEDFNKEKFCEAVNKLIE